jgi:hypothetical protein
MQLPKINAPVPLPKVQEICEHYGLHELWAKIHRDPPPMTFKSDGCSMWFDNWKGVDMYPHCFMHDLKYWSGYEDEDVDRLVADAELMIAVAKAGQPRMAEIMFHGVRVGGHELFRKSYSWGFGRQPGAKRPKETHG